MIPGYCIYVYVKESNRICKKFQTYVQTYKAYEEGLRKVESKNLKSIIKRLKSQGNALGFYHPWRLEDKGIHDKEIKFGAAYFWQYFPDAKML
jgi:hypothetical protein